MAEHIRGGAVELPRPPALGHQGSPPTALPRDLHLPFSYGLLVAVAVGLSVIIPSPAAA